MEEKKEYIDRELFCENFCRCNAAKCAETGFRKCPIFICPTANVAPVVHGKWKLNKDGSGTCNKCGFTQNNVWDYDNWQNYCGVCGAKMDGGEHD